MLPVIRLVHVDESVRIPPDILPVPIARSAEDPVDQPHIKGSVQIEYLPERGKRAHEQFVYESLQLGDRRLIGQGRIKRKDQKPAVDRPGMTVLPSSVIREIRQISVVVLNGLFPDPVRFLSVSVREPFSDRPAIRQFMDRDMICRRLVFSALSASHRIRLLRPIARSPGTITGECS